MEREKNNIVYIEKDEEKKAKLELIENEDNVVITLYMEAVKIEKKGENFFDTLIELREDLEKKNIKLLCKGCCRNVYPSGMLLSMGSGRNAYTLKYGEQAKMETLVDIFDSCSKEEYATVRDQLEYFENLILSLE